MNDIRLHIGLAHGNMILNFAFYQSPKRLATINKGKLVIDPSIGGQPRAARQSKAAGLGCQPDNLSKL
jgi:hypothetical protein